MTEFVWPLFVLSRREVPDTGGAGVWRGGVSGNFAYILNNTAKSLTHVSAAFCIALSTNGAISGAYPGSAAHYMILRKTNVRELIVGGRLSHSLGDLDGEADVALGQGRGVGEVYPDLETMPVTYCWWRSECGRLKLDQAKWLKKPERENARRRKVMPNLTLDKLILKEAVDGNFEPRPSLDACAACGHL